MRLVRATSGTATSSNLFPTSLLIFCAPATQSVPRRSLCRAIVDATLYDVCDAPAKRLSAWPVVVRDYAHRLAEELERELPRLVVSRMTKVLRKGKVLLDWSQNNAVKTTICPYSPRGRERPTVAAPRTWDELEEAAGSPSGLRQLEFDDVIARVQELGDVTDGVLPEPGSKTGRGPKVPTA